MVFTAVFMVVSGGEWGCVFQNGFPDWDSKQITAAVWTLTRIH